MPEVFNPKAKQGYLGYAVINGLPVRCTDFNVNVSQSPLWYDHTIGLRDSIPSTIHDSKEDVGQNQTQKHIWRSSTKLITGNISFPLTENTSNILFDEAKRGSTFSMAFKYTCGIVRYFTGCKVNNWTLNAVAGDIVSVNAEIWAINMVESTTYDLYKTKEKLITWDTLFVNANGVALEDKLANIEVTINNDLKAIYTSGTNSSKSLRPKKFRVGMQEVTGAFGVYADSFNIFDYLEDDGGHTILINAADLLTFSLNVLYVPLERSGSNRVLIHNLPFYGVWDTNVDAIS